MYLISGLSISTYFLYLPFIFILGYVLLNVSMLIDFIKRDIPLDVAIDETIDEVEKTEIVPSIESYLKTIESKTAYGNAFLDVESCYYFISMDDHNHIAEHVEGRFRINKSISAMEKELDPLHFFKCNRKTIINLNYAGNFVYLDKGKYSLSMRAPIDADFIITKARIENYKEALKNNIEANRNAITQVSSF
jgi:two-component system, LytTR family, response regulator